jgi:hypothetical protein
MISVGGSSPFPVTLDTGSSGLRVYADAFTKFGGTPNPGTTADSYGLGGDRTLYGTVGNNDVKFANVNGSGTLDFGSIDYEYVTYICANGTSPPCTSEVPKYEALGLYGTFGVRPDARGDASGLVYTPIGLLPGNLGKGYIVSLGNGTAEQLILGLTPSNTAGFNTYAIGSTLTNGRYLFNNYATVPFCYTITSADGTTSFSNTCGTLNFLTDTGGNPSLQFQQAPTGPESLVDSNGNLVAGTTVSVTLGGTPVWSFTAGGCTDYNKFGVAFSTPAGAENNGVVPFFYNDVMYDLVDGIFGMRPNNTSTPPFCSGAQMSQRLPRFR